MTFRYTSKASAEPYEVLEHARKYVAAMPPAISGQGGHNQTYSVACTLVQGFGLPVCQLPVSRVENKPRRPERIVLS